MQTICTRFSSLLLIVAATAAVPVHAQIPQAAAIEQQQLQRQQERDRALREKMDSSASALRPALPVAALEIPSQESPCFNVHALELSGDKLEQVPWLQASAGIDFGRSPCLGAQGIEIILARMQQALLQRGYVTSRVLSVPQNLQSGVLTVAFIPGVVREVQISPGSQGSTSIFTALPVRRAQMLQLRDVEQGLENLKRVPSAEADIQIAPAEGADVAPGHSDLFIDYQARRPLRLSASLDNGGTRSTGKTQGAATVSWDNPLGLNDLVYASAGGGLANGGNRGTRNTALHYSLPFGYWLASFSGSYNHYHQGVAGAFHTYTYSGEASTLEARLNRVVFRNASAKTTLGAKLFHRRSRNFIDDIQIDVQRRRTSGYELSLQQRSYLGTAVLDASLAFKRGTGAFSALPAPEQAFGEGSSRMRLYIADLGLSQPFALGGVPLRLTSNWHGQWNKTALTPQDRIGIGGRYTVRGFDGERSLLAERGWYWRNELAMPLDLGALGQAQVFVGLDTGRVGGPSTQYLRGKSLTGAAMGVRGSLSRLSYEFFLAAPVSKPEHFQTASTSVGLNLACSF